MQSMRYILEIFRKRFCYLLKCHFYTRDISVVFVLLENKRDKKITNKNSFIVKNVQFYNKHVHNY